LSKVPLPQFPDGCELAGDGAGGSKVHTHGLCDIVVKVVETVTEVHLLSRCVTLICSGECGIYLNRIRLFSNDQLVLPIASDFEAVYHNLELGLEGLKVLLGCWKGFLATDVWPGVIEFEYNLISDFHFCHVSAPMSWMKWGLWIASVGSMEKKNTGSMLNEMTMRVIGKIKKN
jgi:hypothetical protein